VKGFSQDGSGPSSSVKVREFLHQQRLLTSYQTPSSQSSLLFLLLFFVIAFIHSLTLLLF
jgi:hypothetical protein